MWPFLVSSLLWFLTSSLILWFKIKWLGPLISLIISGLIVLSVVYWFIEICSESSCGSHSFLVSDNMKVGMMFFILSEVFFFFGLFWSFFHNSLNPSLSLGNVWPPEGCVSFNPFSIPLLNTLVLLSSGVTVTMGHHCIINNHESETPLVSTVILGAYFSMLQGYEYFSAPFTFCDSVYGSVFFAATGLHGLHVLAGTFALGFCTIRVIMGATSSSNLLGLEMSIWYWHFVDVVWLFLYFFIYWWGS